ncbi:MAG: flagellar basal body P-ring formation protein FlgA [Bryobacterales bacterium]|jgi:flagella basal body P-ring formation protein FlgA|nr:flagellar basal body P-ring formation protein FlgA [Bryobacterales bacterium]
MLIRTLLSGLVPIAVSAACLPLTGDRIFGRDLAMFDGRFSALPASLTVGSAPVPGARRTFAPTELARLARAYGIALSDPLEVCFEIPLKQIESADVLAEMRRSFPSAEVSIVELSNGPVPAGKVEFAVSGLEPTWVSQPGIQLWHGYVRYSETRRVPVWARVSISQTVTAVVAARDLAANVPVDASALRMEKRSGSPVSQSVATRFEDVIGRIPKRTVKAGALIPLSALEKAPDVRRGDAVQVQVVSGSARLQLRAVAERDGRSGEVLEFRNPSSGKTFRARLDGPRAVVLVGRGPGL